jgi:hypothetical protein
LVLGGYAVLRESNSPLAEGPSNESAKLSRLEVKSNKVEPTRDSATRNVLKSERSFPSLPSAAAPVALPPPDVPLRLAYENLKVEADSGSVSAQCRLSFELNRCHQLATTKSQVEALINSAARSNEAASPQVGYADSILKRNEEICEGFTAKSDDTAWRYLLAAADSGHVPSMLRFALQPPLDEVNFARDLEGWEAYRANAGRLLLRAAASGSPEAAYNLFRAYRGYPVPGGGPIVPEDEKLALMYGYVAVRFADPVNLKGLEKAVSGLEQTLSPTDVLYARSHADDLLSGPYRAARTVNYGANPIPSSPSECERPK